MTDDETKTTGLTDTDAHEDPPWTTNDTPPEPDHADDPDEDAEDAEQ